jgi:hypothetical protein
MSKSTNYLKINELEYQALIPAMNGYRKALKAAIGASFRYNRVFTEPRIYGARTKFWYISNNMDTKAISSAAYDYVAKHPAIVVDGVTYEVSVMWMSFMSSLSLHFKAVSRIEKGVKLRRGTVITVEEADEAAFEAASVMQEIEYALSSFMNALSSDSQFKQQSNNNNMNTTTTNNTPSPQDQAIATLFPEKPVVANQCVYMNGSIAMPTVPIEGLKIEYTASVTITDDPSKPHVIEIDEWYYEKPDNSPFEKLSYDEFQKIVNSVVRSAYPTIIKDSAYLEVMIEKLIKNTVTQRISELMSPKPAVVADPKPAFDPQEFYEFMIGHNTFKQIILRAAEQIAEELEGDPESFVDLSMTHNQVEIDIDSRSIEHTITRYFHDEFDECNEENFVRIYKDYATAMAQLAAK